MPNGPTNATRITIKVASSGDFTYDPSVKRLVAGQTVTWACSQGPFSIAFQEGSPFDKLDYHSAKSDKEWSVTTSAVANTRGPGHFHYSVAIYIPGEDRVYLDAGCPEIIIN